MPVLAFKSPCRQAKPLRADPARQRRKGRAEAPGWRPSWALPKTLRALDKAVEARRERKETMMTLRARAFSMSSALNPLAAIAFGADGSTYSTPPVVSTQCWTIRDVFQTDGGSTISIRLHVQPQTTLAGQSLKVRIDGGIHAATRGAHPADGTFTVAAGPNPYTFELVGTTWADHTYTVAGVSYTASHVFGGGRCNIVGTTEDASVQLNLMHAWVRDNAPAYVRYPTGGMEILTERLRRPENCMYEGAGGKNTFFFVADEDDMDPASIVYHAVGTGGGTTDDYGNVAEIYEQGWTVYGNRPHALFGRGMHVYDYGGDDDLGVSISVHRVDVHGLGSAGYGGSYGGHNFKTDCIQEGCSNTWTDGDNWDIKNRLDGDDRVLFRNCSFGWHAMGSQGTNLGPTTALGANPITTVAGSPIVSIARSNDTDAAPGEFVTIAGASTFDGINPNGSWPCLMVDSTGIYFDVGQTPSVGGVSGGGSSATLFMPHISTGDCVVDFRGLRHAIDGGTWTGELFQRNGYRQRGGSEETVNGEGGSEATFTSIKGDDLTPAWVADTAGAGRGFITLLGKGAVAYDITFNTEASIFLAIGSAAYGANVHTFRATGAIIGAQIRGERCKVHDGIFIDWIEKGVEVWGSTGTSQIPLQPDPLTATPGSAVVTVTQTAHGKTTGTSVSFSGIEQDNGITIRSTNKPPAYTLTSTGANTYTITATGSALTADPWGGDAVQANFSAGDHDAVDNQLYNLTFERTDASTAKAISIGKTDGGTDGQASRTRIYACAYIGDATQAWEDSGADTDWAGLNSGFPNQLQADTINVPKTDTRCWTLQGASHTLPVGETSYIIGGLGECREIMIEILGITHSDSGSANFGIVLSPDGGATFREDTNDYQRVGTAGGTASILYCGSVAAATAASGNVTIQDFNQPIRSFFEVNGGQNGATTGAQTAAGYILPTATFTITGGTASAGVNEITDITINGVSVLNTDVDWVTSNTATAAAVAAEINTSSGAFSAINEGAAVIINEEREDGSSVGASVVVTAAGDVTVVTGALSSNPFTPQGVGSGLVTVTDTAHGQANGALVTFTGVVNGSGLTIASTPYTISNVAANSYTISTGGSASSVTAFGGASVDAFYSTYTTEIAGCAFSAIKLTATGGFGAGKVRVFRRD